MRRAESRTVFVERQWSSRSRADVCQQRESPIHEAQQSQTGSFQRHRSHRPETVL